MFGDARRGAAIPRVVHIGPHAFAARSQKPQNLSSVEGFCSSDARREGCHGGISKSVARPIATPVPGGSHVGDRGIRRRGRQIARHRALCGPARWATDQCSRRSFNTGNAPRTRFPAPGERQAIRTQKSAARLHKEICGAGRNRLARRSVEQSAPGEAPQPSPTITRR
jgi:hypothetical protein